MLTKLYAHTKLKQHLYVKILREDSRKQNDVRTLMIILIF